MMWEAASPELSGLAKNKSEVFIACEDDEEEEGEAVKRRFNWV